MSKSRFITVLIIAILCASMLTGMAPAKKGVRGRNLPPDGKVLFIMGQDSDTLHTLKIDVLDVDNKFPRPAGTTLYTNIVGAPLWGMYQPVDYGAGHIDFEMTLNEYGGALAVGLWLANGGDQTPLLAIAGDPSVDPVVVERYQSWTDEMIKYLKRTHRPVYLRIGYEFDNVWNWYQPEPHKAAFRYIKERIDALRARNIATVWQASNYPFDSSWLGPDEPYTWQEEGHWELWYPGDEYVDWVSMSYFYGETYLDHQWACRPDWVAAPPRVIQDSLLDFARAHDKPVMIAEAAPAGFDLANLTAACV